MIEPNKLLVDIRQLSDEMLDGENTGPEYARELAELVSELDCWLTRSGYLPDDWSTAAIACQVEDIEHEET